MIADRQPEPVGPAGVAVERQAAKTEIGAGEGKPNIDPLIALDDDAGAGDKLVDPAARLVSEPAVESATPGFGPRGVDRPVELRVEHGQGRISGRYAMAKRDRSDELLAGIAGEQVCLVHHPLAKYMPVHRGDFDTQILVADALFIQRAAIVRLCVPGTHATQY